jgi:Flp pilus assembly pilin Flp
LTILKNFLRDDQGQGLAGYILLLAFVALAAVALFVGEGGSINSIWPFANSKLGAGAKSAAS